MRTCKLKLTFLLKGIAYFIKMSQCRLAKVLGSFKLLVYYIRYLGEGGWMELTCKVQTKQYTMTFLH